MARDLLIHSMSVFAPITFPILDAVKATVIAEIGAEHGGHSKLLYEWLKARNGKLISIDCNPSKAFLEWLPSAKDVIEHVPEMSLHAIPDINGVDAWFIDGDHNWYTVYHELKALREQSKKQNRPMLLFFHDVNWPWARRDLYYSPDQIPETFRHPFTWEKGVTQDNSGVINGGFRSNGAYAVALKEGGPRNGVLTAIEDFIQEFHGEYCFAHIPAVFGLGIMFDLSHPQAEKIATIAAPFHKNPLLQTLETNRLDNYLKVLEWQDRSETKETPPSIVSQDNTIPTNVVNFEKKAVELVTMLDDESNNPEVWNKMKPLLPEPKDVLEQFIEYLQLLLAVPQDANALKLISILESLCLAKKGDIQSAHNRLEKLHVTYPNCPLIIDAYKQTLSLVNSGK